MAYKYERHNGRYTGVSTPYRFYNKGSDLGWVIRKGASGFLIAEGSGYSVSYGRALYKQIVDDYWRRRKARVPKR